VCNQIKTTVWAWRCWLYGGLSSSCFSVCLCLSFYVSLSLCLPLVILCQLVIFSVLIWSYGWRVVLVCACHSYSTLYVCIIVCMTLYVCMYVCLYVCIRYVMYVCRYVCMHIVNVYICVCMCICICVYCIYCMYVWCMYVCVLNGLPLELRSLPRDFSSSFYSLLKTFHFAQAWVGSTSE